MQPESEAKPKFASRFVSSITPPNQNIPNVILTRVRLDAEILDGMDEFDAAVNYSFTPRRAGYYLLTGQVYWDTTVATRQYQASITRDAALSLALAAINAEGPNRLLQAVCTIAYLTPNNQVWLEVLQASGAPAVLVSGPYGCFLAGHRLS